MMAIVVSYVLWLCVGLLCKPELCVCVGKVGSMRAERPKYKPDIKKKIKKNPLAFFYFFRFRKSGICNGETSFLFFLIVDVILHSCCHRWETDMVRLPRRFWWVHLIRKCVRVGTGFSQISITLINFFFLFLLSLVFFG